MKKQELKLNLEILQDFEDNCTTWITPEYTDPLFTVIDNLLQQIFNKDQYGWVNWWIWETDFGKKKHLTGTQTTTTGVITVNSFDSLWEAIKYLK
jgi:hypothetical protein